MEFLQEERNGELMGQYILGSIYKQNNRYIIEYLEII